MKTLQKHQAKIFPVLDIALNGANYLFNIYIAWYLSPGDFGVVTTLLAVLSLLLVTGVALQLFTAKQLAEEGGGGQPAAARVRQIRRSALLLTGLVTGIYVIAMIPLQGLTRGTYASLGLVLLVFLMNAFLSVDRGVLQGTRRFMQLNLSFYIEVGVKIAIVFWLIRWFPSMDAVFIAIAIGMAAALAHARWANRPSQEGDTAVDLPARDARDLPLISRIYVATFFTYFFTSADLIIVNYFLPEQSGYYAVVLKYTQILLFATLSVITVFIPLLSGAKGDPRLLTRRITMLVGIVVVLIAGVGVAYWAVAGPTVDIFFGEQYGPAKEFILLGLVPYALLILNFVAINLHVVFDSARYLYVLGGSALLLVGLLIVFHSSLATVIWIESGVFAVMLAAQVILLRREIAQDARAATRPPTTTRGATE